MTFMWKLGAMKRRSSVVQIRPAVVLVIFEVFGGMNLQDYQHELFQEVTLITFRQGVHWDFAKAERTKEPPSGDWFQPDLVVMNPVFFGTPGRQPVC